MSDRDDANDIAVSTEDECVRKAAQRNSTMNWIELLSKKRQLEEHASDALDFQNKSLPSPRAFAS
jgi:hypothetical protein